VSVDWGELPPDVRRRLGGTAKARARARPTPERPPRLRRDPTDWTWTYRCAECAATTTEWAKAERHANQAHGGGTVQLLWPQRKGG
jgi:hypothetical protein